MTAAEGTARWQAVEQVREALDEPARGTDACRWCGAEARQNEEPHAPDCPVAALSLLEQLAEAAEDVLGEPRNPEYDLAARQLLAERVAAVRAGSASLTDGPHSGAGRAGA